MPSMWPNAKTPHLRCKSILSYLSGEDFDENASAALAIRTCRFIPVRQGQLASYLHNKCIPLLRFSPPLLLVFFSLFLLLFSVYEPIFYSLILFKNRSKWSSIARIRFLFTSIEVLFLLLESFRKVRLSGSICLVTAAMLICSSNV